MSEFADKVRSLGVLTGGRTRDRIVDGRRSLDAGVDAGQRCKATTDQLGNTTVESSNRQDVRVKAPYITLRGSTEETR